MDEPELSLNIRTPSQIRGMQFAATDNYLPSGIFAKGQPFGIVGPAGVGKSRLLMQLIVCILTGKPFLIWPVVKHDAKWLIVQTENGSARLQKDLNAMAAWIGEKAFEDVDRNVRFHTLSSERDSILSLEDGDNAIRIHTSLAEHRPDVVVFDPLNAFSAGNLNTDAGMLLTCRGLHRLATRHDPRTAVVILHHSLAGKAGMKKAVGADAGSYAKGSKAFTQWIRGQLNIAAASDNGSDLVIACGKNSNGPWFEPFGVMLNPKTMVYEVNPHFDLAAWQASVGVAPTVEVRKLNAATVAALAGPLPISKGKLAEGVMAEYAVAKSRAYEVISQAETAGLIGREGRKLFRIRQPRMHGRHAVSLSPGPFFVLTLPRYIRHAYRVVARFPAFRFSGVMMSGKAWKVWRARPCLHTVESRCFDARFFNLFARRVTDFVTRNQRVLHCKYLSTTVLQLSEIQTTDQKV